MITNPEPLKNSAIALLSLVKGRLDDKDKWTKGAIARDENGKRLNMLSLEKAECWCITGAMDSFRPTTQVYEKAYLALLAVINNVAPDTPSVEGYNDASSTTYKDILNIIDHAIFQLQLEPSDA